MRREPSNWLVRFFTQLLNRREASGSFPENRRQVRSYFEVPITFDAGEELVQATTFDISAEGLFVRTTHLPPSNTILKARFKLPNGRWISCVLRVVWLNDYGSSTMVINRPPGFGATFAKIEEIDRIAIIDAVEMKLI